MSPGTVKVQYLKKMTVLRDSVRDCTFRQFQWEKALFGRFVGGQPHTPGKGHNLRSVFQVQPVHDLRHVIFNRAFAQKQSHLDLFVKEPIG
jgi:hypothetical protein